MEEWNDGRVVHLDTTTIQTGGLSDSPAPTKSREVLECGCALPLWLFAFGLIRAITRATALFSPGSGYAGLWTTRPARTHWQLYSRVYFLGTLKIRALSFG